MIYAFILGSDHVLALAKEHSPDRRKGSATRPEFSARPFCEASLAGGTSLVERALHAFRFLTWQVAYQSLPATVSPQIHRQNGSLPPPSRPGHSADVRVTDAIVMILSAESPTHQPSLMRIPRVPTDQCLIMCLRRESCLHHRPSRRHSARHSTIPRLRDAMRYLLLTTLLLVPATARGEAPLDTDWFETHIRPVLVKHCYECHSTEAGTPKGGLLLDTRDAMREGGDSGPAVVPGRCRRQPAARSTPLRVVRDAPLRQAPRRSHRKV